MTIPDDYPAYPHEPGWPHPWCRRWCATPHGIEEACSSLIVNYTDELDSPGAWVTHDNDDRYNRHDDKPVRYYLHLDGHGAADGSDVALEPDEAGRLALAFNRVGIPVDDELPAT